MLVRILNNLAEINSDFSCSEGWSTSVVTTTGIVFDIFVYSPGEMLHIKRFVIYLYHSDINNDIRH